MIIIYDYFIILWFLNIKINNQSAISEVNSAVVGVTVIKGENIDRALRRFKKKYEKTGILREYKKRTAFVKPSIEKRMQSIRSSRRQYRISKEMNL